VPELPEVETIRRHLAPQVAPTLSGGEHSRVSLARVLAQDTRVVILDEPSASLDLCHQQRLLELCHDLAGEGRAVLAVLHDLNQAAAAHRVAVLASGRIVADGPPEEVLTEATVATTFGLEIVVVPHPVDGRPVVLPKSAPARALRQERSSTAHPSKTACHSRTACPNSTAHPSKTASREAEPLFEGEAMSIVRINAITVPDGRGDDLEHRFRTRASEIDGRPGFEGFTLLRPTDGSDRYFVVTHWDSEESFAAWRDGDARAAHATPPGEAPRKPVSTGADLLEFEVVLDVKPA
jgi:heme oxygenase (mycobilin-producing)